VRLRVYILKQSPAARRDLLVTLVTLFSALAYSDSAPDNCTDLSKQHDMNQWCLTFLKGA
jgi:hypothetical protein